MVSSAERRYLPETDAQSNGMHPHCDQSGQLNCLPPKKKKGPFLQQQACVQWGPLRTDTLRISAGTGGDGALGLLGEPLSVPPFSVLRWTSQPPHRPLKLPEGRGLNVTLGHQSAQPPARVSWGKHAQRQGEGERKAKGREALALAPLSIAIGMCC